ncbi:hypothetical protein HDR67_00360 [bacterium]|nr:hypothetical protein [bacterium]
MEFKNPNQVKSYLEIYVKQDGEVQNIPFIVDGKTKYLSISNQGYYALALNNFSFCKVEENSNLEIVLKEWDSSFEKIIQSYKNNLVESNENLTGTLEDLYVNLPSEYTERIYQTFKRIFVLAVKSVQNQDHSLRQAVLLEFKKLMDREYLGKSNYEGNWWVYEIGIPRCVNETLIVLYDAFTQEEIMQYMAIENFYIPTPEYEYYRRNYPNIKRIYASYANLADTIYVCLLRNILIQNQIEIDRLYSLLPSLFQIKEEGNGFRKDGGFIFHENIPYTASYGEVLLSAVTKILEVYYLLERDCSEFCEKIYPILERSYMPFLYHHHALNCVRGRASSRTKGEKYSFEIVLKSFRKLVKFFSKDGFIDYILNEEVFHHYTPKTFVFNSMDRYLKRSTGYLLAISGHSKNVADYESINGENLLGSYQANFTFDLYYNKPTSDDVLSINPLYRNGSTNVLRLEPANQPMENQITSGVSFNSVLNTCFHQNNDVKGYFSKFVLENSFVAIGTNIHSEEPYVSTVYNFEETYSYHKNVAEAETFQIIFEEDPIFEVFHETRSYHELNQNELHDEKKFQITRAYYKNPKQYGYQFYPIKKSVEDEYEKVILPTTHILIYKNLYFINSFETGKFQFKTIHIDGIACMIFKVQDDEILLRLSSDFKQEIFIHIDGFSCVEADLIKKEDNFIIEDEYEHTILFRRD